MTLIYAHVDTGARKAEICVDYDATYQDLRRELKECLDMMSNPAPLDEYEIKRVIQE